VSISTLIRPAEPILNDELAPTEGPDAQKLADWFHALISKEGAAAALTAWSTPPRMLRVEVFSNEELASLARRAAEVVLEAGWTRGTMVNHAGQVCAMGALATAANPPVFGPGGRLQASRIVGQCADRFARWLGAWCGVPSWNDGQQIKPTRIPSPQNAVDVAAAFHGFADAVLAGNA
jgi:hypothetical protein